MTDKRMIRFFSVIAVYLISALFLAAQNNPAPNPEQEQEAGAPDASEEDDGVLTGDLAGCVGWTLEQSYDVLGVPDEVFPLRGEKDLHDTVVFYFDEHLYLFWYKNRVWQVRADHRYGEKIEEAAMGMPEKELVKLFGKPYYRDGGSIIYNLPDRGYPLRMRLFFEDGILRDLYIYRSDF